MPRYFYDCEFIDDGVTIDLISIGIVCEDGKEYYGQSSDFSIYDANEWVKENVFPQLRICVEDEAERAQYDEKGLTYSPNEFHLGVGKCRERDCPWRTREQIKAEILAFMDPQRYGPPELWACYGSYDHVALCQLFGTMMDLPQGFPMYTNDLKQWQYTLGDPEFQEKYDHEHNALADAKYNKRLWEFLAGLAKGAS